MLVKISFYFTLLLLVGCKDCSMDFTDNKFKVQNVSERNIMCFIKDSSNSILTRESVKAHEINYIPLVNEYWSNILKNPYDFVVTIFVDDNWWMRTNDLRKLTDENILKKIILMKKELDSLNWIVTYSENY